MGPRMPPRTATDADDPLHLRTAWHPLLILLLERLLPRDLWEVLAEYALTREPRRIDAVIVRRAADAHWRPRTCAACSTICTRTTCCTSRARPTNSTHRRAAGALLRLPVHGAP
jgi:hypothetical protein